MSKRNGSSQFLLVFSGCPILYVLGYILLSHLLPASAAGVATGVSLVVAGGIFLLSVLKKKPNRWLKIGALIIVSLTSGLMTYHAYSTSVKQEIMPSALLTLAIMTIAAFVISRLARIPLDRFKLILSVLAIVLMILGFVLIFPFAPNHFAIIWGCVTATLFWALLLMISSETRQLSKTNAVDLASASAFSLMALFPLLMVLGILMS